MWNRAFFVIAGVLTVSESSVSPSRMELLFLQVLTVISTVLTPLARAQSDRLSRRQRILSILQTYQPTPAPAPAVRTYSYSFESSSSGVARDSRPTTWVSWNTGWYGDRQTSPARTTPPPTIAPPESPYDLWYYKDDSEYVQGPFSSSTMLEWQKAGYFR